MTLSVRNEGTINGFGTAVSGTITSTLSGSTIVVSIISQLASGNSSSVTDNIGNTYTLQTSNTAATQRHTEQWTCINATAGVTSVTINNGTSANVVGSIVEVAVSGGAVTVRQATSSANSSSGSPAAAAVSANTNDIVIGCLGYQAATASTRQDTLADGTYTALTSLIRGTTTMWASAYKVVSSNVTTGPTWTMSPAVSTGESTISLTQATTAPTAAFSSTVYGHTAVFSSAGSTGNGGATITGYSWTFGDGGTSTAANPTYRYTNAGTNTVSPIDGTTNPYLSSITATGWTPSTSTALAVVSDNTATTFIASSGNPTSLELDGVFAPLAPPASGQPFVVTLVVDRLTSTSGTVNAQIFDFDGTTQRSALSGITIQDMSASGGSGTTASGTVAGLVQLVFPWSDVQNVTASGWDKLTLKMQFTAS
jgi:PKD repeat protein